MERIEPYQRKRLKSFCKRYSFNIYCSIRDSLILTLNNKEMTKKKEKEAMVTVVAIAEKKSKLVTGQDYEVTKEVADALVKLKRAKIK